MLPVFVVLQIALLKNNFGTIACCERARDVFFHFDSLEGCISSDLAVGDDVEFNVSRDETSKKLAAVRCGSNGIQVLQANLTTIPLGSRSFYACF